MRRVFLPLAVLILLAAAFLRLWQLHLYPPGPHYDEAVYLLITRTIAFGGARPFPIVEAYQGREVLYMYLNAPLLRLLGDSIFTMRLASAFYNLITIAASMALGRAMFRGQRGLLIGLSAGVLMALSFPQIFIARQGFRAVTLPLCQSLALLFLWRGLNARRGWGWLAAGGLLAGLTLYTYMASRLFPLWLLAGGLVLLLADCRNRSLRLRQGALFFGVLTLVAAPMVAYALQKPDIFFGRLEEVTQAGQSVSLAESVRLHLRMFFIEGDPYLRYNVPGRPYLTWLEGAFMLAGMAAAAWRLFRPGRAAERAGYALALLSPLMVIPSLISVGGFPPSHMRSLGMTPLIFILVGAGVELVVSRLFVFTPRAPFSERLFEKSFAPLRGTMHRGATPASMTSALVVAVLGVGGALAGQVYFDWAGRADLFYEADGDLAAAAKWLPAQADDQTRVYVAARDRGHPTVMIEPVPPIIWLGTSSLFRAPHGYDGLYVFPRSAPPPSSWRDWLEAGRIAELPLGPDGRPAFEAFRLSGDTPLPTSDPLPDQPVASQYLALEGVQSTVIGAGSRGRVTTEWRVENTPPFADLTPLVQLEDEFGNVLDRRDVYMLGTDEWLPGEVLFQRLEVRVPVGTPPGHYPVRVAWVGRESDAYVPYTASDGRAAIWADVGRVEVIRPSEYPDPDALPVAVRRELDLAPGIRLLGWNPPQTAARPGEALLPTLFWQALPVPDGSRSPLLLEAMLRSQAGDTVIWSGEPVNDTYSPEQWVDGELVTDHERWAVAREQPGGRYRLILRAGLAEADMGDVEIAGLPRLFEPPAVAERETAVFGGALQLYGYTVETGQGTLRLDLVWRALRTVDQNYTVFVHVLDEQGNIVAQRDVSPQDGAYPTSLWEAGEYVPDSHIFSGLAPGAYMVAAGFYSQASGARLSLSDSTKVLDENALKIGHFDIY